MTLTDAGFNALEAAAPDHVEDVQQLLFDNITEDEYTNFSTVVQRMAANIQDLS